MPKLSVFLALLLGGWWTFPGNASGQEGVPGVIYSKYRHFRIPFQAGPGEQRLKQLQLYVSMDQGKTWQPAALAAPEQGHFRFLTDRDGYFWFAVQTQDLEGKQYPGSMEGAQPNLKVVVDTQAPLVQVQPLSPRGEEVGVAWDIRDENLDLTLPDAIQVEYRPMGSNSWLPLPRNPLSAQLYWNPMTKATVEVRVRARDRAGNWGDASSTVSLDGTGQGLPGGGEEAGRQFPGLAQRKLVNNKRITLRYELKDVGPSGVSEVELWYTQDGRSWNKYPPRQGEDPIQKSLAFEVSGEGIFGLTLVAKSGVGLSLRPPQLGDRPQSWIEVDMTKPVVQIQNVVVGQGADKGKLTMSWSARDKNLHPQPITLSYGENQAGPWTPIIQNQANTSQYVWTLPERVPYQFYVRIEAVDLAGNVGSAITSQMIKVDLSQPKVQILNVEPAGN